MTQTQNESKTAPKFGIPIAQYGKWIVTASGILFEGKLLKEQDYFLEADYATDPLFIKAAVTKLLETDLLDELDYHDFILAWFELISVTKTEHKKDGSSLADTLAEIQLLLENKFSAQLLS